jgi:hypothetical protein
MTRKPIDFGPKLPASPGEFRAYPKTSCLPSPILMGEGSGVRVFGFWEKLQLNIAHPIQYYDKPCETNI